MLPTACRMAIALWRKNKIDAHFLPYADKNLEALRKVSDGTYQIPIQIIFFLNFKLCIRTLWREWLENTMNNTWQLFMQKIGGSLFNCYLFTRNISNLKPFSFYFCASLISNLLILVYFLNLDILRSHLNAGHVELCFHLLEAFQLFLPRVDLPENCVRYPAFCSFPLITACLG